QFVDDLAGCGLPDHDRAIFSRGRKVSIPAIRQCRHATGVEPSLLEELLGVRIPDRDGPVRGSSSDAPAVRTVGYRNTEKSCRRSWSERLRSEERRVGKVCKCGEWGGGLHGMHDLAI